MLPGLLTLRIPRGLTGNCRMPCVESSWCSSTWRRGGFAWCALCTRIPAVCGCRKGGRGGGLCKATTGSLLLHSRLSVGMVLGGFLLLHLLVLRLLLPQLLLRLLLCVVGCLLLLVRLLQHRLLLLMLWLLHLLVHILLGPRLRLNLLLLIRFVWNRGLLRLFLWLRLWLRRHIRGVVHVCIRLPVLLVCSIRLRIVRFCGCHPLQLGPASFLS